MSSGIRRIIPFYIILMLWVTSWSTSVNGPVMPLYVVSLGVGENVWGYLAMFQAVGMVLFEWLWGALSDRGNRLVYALISLSAMSMIFPAYTLTGVFPFFFLFQFLLGSFSIIMGPVSRAIVSEQSDPDLLGLSMSLWFVFATLGSMFGSISGSYIAQNLAYEYTFYVSTGLSALGALVTVIYLKKRTGQKHRSKPGLLKSFRSGLKTLSSRGSLKKLLLMAALYFMARSVLWTFLPLYASIVVGMSTVEVGILSAVISFTGLIASIIIGKLSPLFRKNLLVASGFFAASILIVLYLFVDTAPLTYLTSIGVSISLSVSPLIVAMVSETASQEHLGLSMGIFGSFEDIGAMLGPAIYGLVWANLQPGYIFIVSGIVQLLSAFLALTIRTEENV